MLLCAAAPLAALADAEDEGKVHEGGRILVQDERLRPVEVFKDTAVETEWVPRETIERIPGTNAADVVRNLAGIRTQQRIQGEDAAVSIEGMPPEYTLILVDGRRWSGEIGGVGDLASIPIENVRRIEILRGSQGTRFGSDAGGGVINVVTFDPPDEGARGSYRGQAGDANAALASGVAQGRLGAVGLSLQGQYEQIDGFDPAQDPGIVSAQVGGERSKFKKGFLYGKLDAPVAETVTVRGSALWRIEDDQFVAVGAYEDPGVSPEPFPKRDTSWRAGVGADWVPTDSTSVQADFGYYAVRTKSEVGRSFVLDEDEFRLDGTVDQFFDTGPVSHALLVGGDVRVQRLFLDEGRLPAGVDNPDLAAGRNVRESFAIGSVFLQNESTLTSWLTVVLGLRGRFHTEFHPAILPQAAVLVTPLENLKLRGSWGMNFRTPNLRELYQPPTPQLGGAYFLAGNEDLEPEQSMSVRGGFEWSPASWLSLASNAFFNDIEDRIRSQLSGEIPIGSRFELIVPTPSPELQLICDAQALNFPDPADWTPECRALANGTAELVELPVTSNVFRKTNLDAVRTWGVEVQMRARYRTWVNLEIDYTWLRTKIVDSNVDFDQIPNEPEHVIDGRLTLTAPRIDTRLTGVLRWRSGVIPERSGTGLLSFADASVRTAPSYSIDARITQPIRPWLHLFVDGKNLTNQPREDSYAIRGRTITGGIRGEFGGF